jgi:hypothetical protein
MSIIFCSLNQKVVLVVTLHLPKNAINIPGFIESWIFLLAPDLFSGVGQFGQLLRVGRVQLFGLLLQLFNLVRTDLLPLIRDLFANLKFNFF